MKKTITYLFPVPAIMAFMMVIIQPVLFNTNAFAGDALEVMASIAPQKYFIEKIGGEFVNVSIMVSPGASPAIYEPQAKQMMQLTRCKLYFAIGVPFETVWMKKLTGVNPDMKVVYLQKDIKRIMMKGTMALTGNDIHDREAEDHSRHGGHGGMKDPHIWLSPPLVMMQARNILDALQSADPEHAKTYEDNYRDFMGELIDLDLRIKGLLTVRGENRQFMTYHPSWGYFAAAYGLEQIPIEIEGKEPTPKELHHLISFAKKRGMKVIFVQPQFSTKNAETVAKAIGGMVVVADPLSMDWRENLLAIAGKIKRAIGE